MLYNIWGHLTSCSQVRSNKVMLCLLVSSHAINKCPFCSLFGATFVLHFCGGLLVFSLLNGPQPSVEVLSSVPRCRKAIYTLWRKYLYWISFVQARVIVLLPLSLMLRKEQHTLNKHILNRNT